MKKDVYNLTKPQMSIYMTEKFSNDSTNNIMGSIYFKSDIDVETLKEAMFLTIKNNQALRTRIFEENGVPKQFFSDSIPSDITVKDFSQKTMNDFKIFQTEFVQELFTLLNGDLCKFVICILPNKKVAFFGKFHHIIVDAWASALVLDNIIKNYEKLQNHQVDFETAGLYTDFIDREQKYLSSDTYAKNKEFWNNELKNVQPVSIKTSPSTSNNANRVEFILSLEETNLINDFCKQNRISAYALFLAAINIYLYRTTSGQFSIQTPILNRIGKEKNTIGMFINMISIPNNIDNNYTIMEYLQKVALDSIKYFKNSKYPYVDLLNDLRKNSNSVTSRNVVYSFQNMRPNSNLKNTLDYNVDWTFPGCIQDELVINITDVDNSGTYHISYDYLLDLFSIKEIDFMHERIKRILLNIIENPNQKIVDIDFIPESEKSLLLNDFNDTSFEYDSSKTLVDLFEEAVQHNPEKVALIYNGEEFTYQKLNNMASLIATKLTDENISNSRVAILCKKSAWMVAGLLGIMKSGNCYIPIDGEYPKNRINYILNDSKCAAVVTSLEYADSYDIANKIVLENFDSTLTCNYKSIATPENLAYMIYTSGTTGNPKGVQIKHKNILNTLIWRKNFYKFDSSYVVLQIPSFSFDSSVEDIFTTLISGSTLVIPSVTRMDVNVVAEEIKRYGVTHFLVVPSLYKILLHEKLDFLSSLKIITIAGEKFPVALVKEHFEKLPNVRLINEYGPTENSVCSTYYELTSNDDEILIGRPINNCKAYVLNEKRELLPIGCKGELYVSGPGVCSGYWNKPDLNKASFLDNPFGYNYKMYKTGDIAKWDCNGNLVFLGRNDGQVKLHGLRIELEEIEEVILSNKNVSDALVLVKENLSKNQILVAYVTSYDNNFDVNELYEKLRKKLPFYMIPSIVKLDEFPLTPNGKVDKNALPMPINKNNHNVLPRNDLENDILNVCRDVLNNDNLGIFDDFFTDGDADSLSILTMNSRLFAKDLFVRTQDFYKYSNVAELAKHISYHKIESDDNVEYMVKPKLTVFPKDVSPCDLAFPYKNVLLTGATGFLGIHILDYLLRYTDCMIYCIVRKKNNVNPFKRLMKLSKFYFDDSYFDTYKNRVIILDGELSKHFFGLSQEDYSNLQKNIDCIINTAANTSHYGNYSDFEKENVLTVKNLILFAKPANILLNHMSTTNVSGNYLVENNISYNFTENDFYVGQNYEDNVYIHSKFEAEKLILDEEYKGLNANIFRLGNLMARSKDGKFQMNKYDNAYYTRLVALAKLKVLPDNLKSQSLEFTPIDSTAEAIIKLLTIPNLKNNIFHIFSNKLIDISLLLDIFSKYGCDCKFTTYDKFIKELHLQKNEKILKYIVSDLNYTKKFDYSSDIIINQDLTNKFLELVNFEWPVIDKNYLMNFFDKSDFVNDTKE